MGSWWPIVNWAFILNKKLHSKALNKNKVKHIIYYLGVNDQGLTKLSVSELKEKNCFKKYKRLFDNNFIFIHNWKIFIFQKHFQKHSI